eukprot:CAMPEP_0170941392 /NCGR_PEP_ID=MMETSP0735-20130129/23405_1 /TAXON_ID=186038 /ORGANISM="Fragilariopsis kerguelensis, Strain L26-C5" /LENGTH=299 /DNA_ID=CAMNT_0011347761 /DNA_START=62 /DNA_END=959 /DNA_ORIENTATION=+
MSSSSGSSDRTDVIVVVVRHGERLDYVMRDAGDNWIPTTDRPWDPPLTSNGKEQARTLGKELHKILKDLKLPSSKIDAVYSSPFYRCRQTAAGIISGEVEASEIKAKQIKKFAVGDLHPASKESIQISPILNWKSIEKDETRTMIDDAYVSKSKIETPYILYPEPKFENYKTQRNRMLQTLKQLTSDTKDDNHSNNVKVIVMVSHGGPVTHLYESLTGNHWNAHGISKYCCYSIYQKEKKSNNDEEDDGDNKQRWTPLVVNQTLWGKNTENGATTAAAAVSKDKNKEESSDKHNVSNNN